MPPRRGACPQGCARAAPRASQRPPLSASESKQARASGVCAQAKPRDGATPRCECHRGAHQAPKAPSLAREIPRVPRRTSTAATASIRRPRAALAHACACACAAAPRSLQTLARAGSRRAASGRSLKTLGQGFTFPPEFPSPSLRVFCRTAAQPTTLHRTILTTTAGPLALAPTVPPAARVPWGAERFRRGSDERGKRRAGAGKAGTPAPRAWRPPLSRLSIRGKPPHVHTHR